MTTFSLDFPCAYGGPLGRALFRVRPEDFRVQEDLGWQPQGSGEHLYLHLEKRGENTAWVARQLAELAQVRLVDVGYCGLKDRRAVTRQWFSIYLPGTTEPDWQALPATSIRVLAQTRHRAKLRRGQHRGNHFVICLRQVQADASALEQRLRQIATGGCPNYFGEQRFGRQGGNLLAAEKMLAQIEGGGRRLRDRQQRGLILSAARSYLFNCVLARRVEQGNWAVPLDGEVLLEGGPSAPLWGRGRSAAAAVAAVLEQQVLAHWQVWCNGLEHTGLRQERRAAVLRPQRLAWCWRDTDLELAFALAPGQFATALLRELLVLES